MTRRRRRYPGYHLGWTYTFLPGLAIPFWGWTDLREPYHLAGLGALVITGLLVIPASVVAVLYFSPAFIRSGLVPRDWRKRYRQRHGREGARSAYIPAGLRRVVFAADRYRCTACHARLGIDVGHLEVDHVLAWSLGGLTTFFNVLTLCPRCNRVKSNYWRYRRSGNAVYVPFPGAANQDQAAAILRRELRHRWNPFRLMRAALALGF